MTNTNFPTIHLFGTTLIMIRSDDSHPTCGRLALLRSYYSHTHSFTPTSAAVACGDDCDGSVASVFDRAAAIAGRLCHEWQPTAVVRYSDRRAATVSCVNELQRTAEAEAAGGADWRQH